MPDMAAAPPWIPEDDLLLKSAVETGASLEALAKGAVRFSRKFTVAELRDRWHSLLYDPVVSAEASARMIDFELSAKKSGSGNKNSGAAAKRKFESVRRMYYATRKRICRDSRILELSDTNYLMDLNVVEENPNGYMVDDSYGSLSEQAPVFKLKQSARFCENACKKFPSTCGDSAELREEIGCSHALPNSSTSYRLSGFPSVHSGHSSWKHIADNSSQGMPTNVSLEDKVQVVGEAMLPHDTVDCTKCSSTKHDSLHDDKILPDERNGDQIGESAAISDKYLMDISDCLLNFANEDDLASMDMDEKASNYVGQDVKYEKSRGTGDSCILSCPGDKCEDNALIPGDAQIKEGTAGVASQGSDAEKLDATAGHVGPGHSDQSLISLDIDKPLSTTTRSTHLHVEMYEEVIVCILNSEDPEIPCNDDFPSPTSVFCSTTQQRRKGSTSIAFPSADREKKLEEQNIFREEENKPESASMIYQMKGTCTQAVDGANYHVINTGGNFEVSSGQCAGTVLKEALDVQEDTASCRLLARSPGCAKDCTPVDKSSTTDFPIQATENSTLSNIPELNGSTSKVDYDEQDECDSHIPNFDDIEAMILDMDLWPKDWDSYASKEVSRYKNEDARRAIIRMEQCAQSSVQRAIGSRGALAILYGRHSKHYIRKAEVVLGRSTNDFDVDIDLVREGGTNRISRRQALIKLESEGSFSLKNLGKNSMFLNGKEVYNGQCIRLAPSCLIEVKGIGFVFEMNGKSVRQYLRNLARGSRRENNSFEWSPEGIP